MQNSSNKLKSFIQDFTKNKSSFSKEEERYISDVILHSMEDEAMEDELNEGSSLFSHLSKRHKLMTEKNPSIIKGIDTFGLIIEAQESLENIDYKEEIKDHGRSYVWYRMIENREVNKPIEKAIKQSENYKEI